MTEKIMETYDGPELTKQELGRQANELADGLAKLFDGRPLVSIAAAIHVFVKNQKELREMIGVLAFGELEDAIKTAAAVAGQTCQCAECASKRGQA